MPFRQAEGAFRKGAPFAFLRQAACVLLCAMAATVAAGDCPADRPGERVAVAEVFDGDTVRLRDGRKVRFIGIDTPELGRDGRPSQPMADAARAEVVRLLAGGLEIELRPGAERHDRYGRMLAHVFLPDGRNVTAHLLERGLGTALTVPPNLWQLACYRRAEARAQAAARGIWALDAYRQRASESLGRNDTGFHIVTGRVERVGESASAIWLNLTGRLALRIPRQDLPHFPQHPRLFQGRSVVARGWLHYHGGELRMTVRHPAALTTED